MTSQTSTLMNVAGASGMSRSWLKVASAARASASAAKSQKESRSVMNIVFRLPSEQDEERFVAEAKKRGMVGLKGHRSVGGIRVSTYNAVEPAWIDELAAFMGDFARKG